jgi:dTDP-4-amino-4,6-dideoxygalactose transaminase
MKKHLLMDANIILDLWLARGEYWRIENLLQEADKNRVALWISASSIPVIEYVFIKELKKDGATKKEARELFKRLFALLHDHVKPLSNFGFDQHVAIEKAFDIEEAQIAMTMMCLHGEKRIVTNNADFDTLGLAETCSINDALAWLISDKHETDQLINFIDLSSQQDAIRPQLEKHIHTILHHGKYILGPEIQALEKKLADFAGVKHGIGVSSGTDALLICLMTQGIGPGDAVFTTPFTFIATAEIVSLLGATPVFVDIDPATYNIDPDQLKLAVEAVKNCDATCYSIPKNKNGEPLKLTPKAIIPVDLFGLPADYDRIMEIAEKYNLFVVEDAAQGLGGNYKGKVAGGLGHMGATSFFPAKPLGCYGDGGAVFTSDDKLAKIARSIRVHGKGTHKYDNIRIGLNARLHTIQAAVLLPKLEGFPKEIKDRQQVANAYTEGLKDTHLTTPFVPNGLQSVWAQYSVLAENRDVIQNHLKKQGIPTAIYYAKPLHLQPAYNDLGYSKNTLPVSERVSQQIFSLPMHPYLTSEEIKKIINAIFDVA